MRVRGGASVTDFFPTQKQNLKRFGRADEGQALVLTALALVVLLLMAGLGVDVGYLRYQKQQLQKAADAGALAGASAYAYNGDWNAAAVADVNANGFTGTKTNGLTITVNSPPKTAGDPFVGQVGYVEVIVKQNQPTFFMRVNNVYAVPVSARAVASAVAPGSGCIIAMDPNRDSGTFLVVGNVTISSTCSIYVNSSSPTALVKTGSSGTVAANYIGLVGDQQSGLTGVFSQESFGQDPVTDIAPLTDPLANVPAPHYDSNCTYRNFSTAGGRVSPGTYCDGITITGSGAVTFASGNYILRGGGLNVSGASSLSGSDVMFYLTGDGTYPYSGITMSGSETVSLSAPTTGPQAGMLFFQDRSMPITSPGSTFGGSRGTGYTGAIYFPTTAITYKGNASSTSTPTIIVGYKLTFMGGDTNIKNYTYLPSGGGPITSAILVE
jgi:Flp pilus assembly protein TadG